MALCMTNTNLLPVPWHLISLSMMAYSYCRRCNCPHLLSLLRFRGYPGYLPFPGICTMDMIEIGYNIAEASTPSPIKFNTFRSLRYALPAMLRDYIDRKYSPPVIRIVSPPYALWVLIQIYFWQNTHHLIW